MEASTLSDLNFDYWERRGVRAPSPPPANVRRVTWMALRRRPVKVPRSVTRGTKCHVIFVILSLTLLFCFLTTGKENLDFYSLLFFDLEQRHIPCFKIPDSGDS